jgi:hypothetical protein
MKRLPYSNNVTTPKTSETSDAKRLSSSYVLKNYPYSDLQAHKKYLSNSKKSHSQNMMGKEGDFVNNKSSQVKLKNTNIIFSSILMIWNMTTWLPRKIFKIYSYLSSIIDRLSIDRIKVYRLTSKFPLFLDFFLPARVKHIKLNGVTLPPVIHNGRIYIDDRFLKLGKNEIRLQYYSKVNMLPTGLMEDEHKLTWDPKGIGMPSLFPSFDQSLFNITMSCQSKNYFEIIWLKSFCIVNV